MRSKLAKRRHTRRSNFSRLRKTRSVFRNWMAAQNVRLATTGDLIAFTASVAVEAAESLTFTGNAANNETVTIGGQIYTYKTALAGGGIANEILIGAAADDTKDNTVAAINKAAGEGTTYGNDTIVNAFVVGSDGGLDVVDVTAILSGEIGNEIAVTEEVANASWGAALLSGGVDTILTDASHGLVLSSGPFRLSNSGGALPDGLTIDTDYFVVEVPDANTFKMGLSKNADPAQASDTGTGTQSYARCDSDDSCIHDLLKTNTSERIQGATDIDDLG